MLSIPTNTQKAKETGVHMHRFPKNLEETAVVSGTKHCCNRPERCQNLYLSLSKWRYSDLPSLTLRKRFASPKKCPATFRLPAPPMKICKQRKQSVFSSPCCSYSPSVQSLLSLAIVHVLSMKNECNSYCQQYQFIEWHSSHCQFYSYKMHWSARMTECQP